MKASITQTLLAGILAGEERTYKEWAEILYNEDDEKAQSHVRSLIAGLRERGFMVFLIEKNGKRVPKFIGDDAVEFNVQYNKHATQQVEPRLVNSFRFAQELLKNHPQLRLQVIDRANDLIRLANESNKELLGLTYGTSDKRITSGRK